MPFGFSRSQKSAGSHQLPLLMVFLICIAFFIMPVMADSGAGENTRTITDMRGVQVKVPKEINRVVIIDDGFVEGLLYRFGKQDLVVGVGGDSVKKVFEYNFTTRDGEFYEYTNGMNTVRYLFPEADDLPLVTDGKTGINYELLASLEPDLVIVRAGAYAFRAGSEEALDKALGTISSLGIPVFVLYGPTYQDNASVDRIADEIKLIGEIFDEQASANELADYLDGIITDIKTRTAGVPDAEKPRVMEFGLSSTARGEGGAGMAWGLDTIETHFIEDIANAKSPFTGTGAFVVISAEQMLALDPDVIILPTAQGYHPAKEIYTAPYYQNLQELTAVKNKQVFPLPWTPYNWAKRLEYPIEAMIIAKASYPDKFTDIRVADWVLDFYKKVYKVDDKTAKELRSVQWLDWVEEENF